MANLKEIKIRIGSVKKTRQITAAMKLVAASKLKKATDRSQAAQPYQERLSETLVRVAARAGDAISHPLLEKRESITSVLIVILTSDRGLCGGFNSNLMRPTIDLIAKKKAAGATVDLLVYGRKGNDFLKSRKHTPIDAILDYSKRDKMALVRELSERMMKGFISKTYDQVIIARQVFVNTLIQNPGFEQIIPIDVPVSEDEELSLIDYKYEPMPAELLGNLLPLYLRTQILQGFLEAEAGEFAARMTAMENATKNAGEIIDNLTLEYNRARQAAITTEIIEIVSGAEALK